MFGADRFKEIFEKYNDRPILLYGDPDCDGLISLRLMCEFATMFGLNYVYHVNDKRHHGFALQASDLRGYLVIGADFTITQDEVQALVDNDVVVLSTDHHDCQDTFIDVKSDTAEGIVINNQYPFEPDEDRYLSGAGVFYELICSIYPQFASKERKAMVGITLLTDIRQIENAKARDYLKTTYTSDPQIGFAHYLIDSTMEGDYTFGMPKLDRNFIDYTLSPRVNALLRFNRTQEAIDFILGRGLVNNSYRSDQKSIVEVMNLRAQICPFTSIVFLVINCADFMDYSNVDIQGFIGLFCSNYKDRNKGISTLGMVVDNGKVVRASFRGKYDDIHYLSGFRCLGIKAEGHHNAFGVLDFNPTQDLWFKIDDLVADLEAEHKPTINVVESSNLSLALNKYGANFAYENLYVRDMYRSYIKYTGKNAVITRTTYKTEAFSPDDYVAGITPDLVVNGESLKYIKDSSGNPVPKYIEYLIDGRTVKSFGALIENGLILPILEKGYMQLYVHSDIS